MKPGVHDCHARKKEKRRSQQVRLYIGPSATPCGTDLPPNTDVLHGHQQHTISLESSLRFARPLPNSFAMVEVSLFRPEFHRHLRLFRIGENTRLRLYVDYCGNAWMSGRA